MTDSYSNNNRDTTLEFLGELDCTLLSEQPTSALTEANHTAQLKSTRTSKTTAKSRTKKTRKSPNLSWLYRKQELTGLREDSKLLTKRLIELQWRRASAPEKWKAGHERMHLKKSLDVQSQLKEKLQEHSRVTKAMEQIMKRFQEFHEEETFYKLVASKLQNI